jgi:hypothetical protein
MRVQNTKFTRLLSLITSTGLLVAVGILVNLSYPGSVSAIAGWNAGNIIDDGVFTNKDTMTPTSIQAFLQSKVPVCDTWGEQTSEFGGGTRREWGEARGYFPPYTCLRDYSENGKLASQIIYDAAQEFSINPQVLIVLLQKEQGLVTDTWPTQGQYRSATGYGCPDTAPCDSQYYGLTNQLRWAARMFRAILNDSPTWYTPYELGNSYIQYNPSSSCGGSNVNIENSSTQALYNYTPYQPNQGALDAGWGTAPCGAYGNRNFYLYFVSWFGSVRVQYEKLQTPRWMELSESASKVDPYSNTVVSGNFASGTQLRFVDQIFVNNTWYLRTEFDSLNGFNRGFRLGTLREIQQVALTEPGYMELVQDRKKWNPISGYSGEINTFKSGTVIKFTSKITLNGQEYFKTEFDTINNNELYFTAANITEVQFRPFESPRYLRVKSNATKIDVATSEQLTPLEAGADIKFTAKTNAVNGIVYFQSEAEDAANSRVSIPSNLVEEISYTPLNSSYRWMLTNQNTNRWQPNTNTELSVLPIAANTDVRVSQIITVDGKVYYRTLFDQSNNQNRAIPAVALDEINYEPMEQPRSMVLTKPQQKLTPNTDATSGGKFSAGTSIQFSQKIIVNGIVYLRSAFDTQNNNNLAIPLSSLRSL